MSNQMFFNTITEVCEKEIERRLNDYLDRLSNYYKIEKVDLLTICKNEVPITNHTENYKKMTVKELRKKCNDMGIRTLNYPKQVLIEKLVAHELNPPETNAVENHLTKKQINTFTKKELISYCKEHGIPYKHNDVKQKILAGVEEHFRNRQQNVESSQQENDESFEQENVESSEQENVESSEQQNVESSQQENVESSEQENVESSKQENDESSEQENDESSEQENDESSEQENDESSEQENDESSEQESGVLSTSSKKTTTTSISKKKKYKRTVDIVPTEFHLEEPDTNNEMDNLLTVDLENGATSSKSTEFVLSTTDLSTLSTVDPDDYRNMLQNLSNHSITNKMNKCIEKNKSRVLSCIDVYSMNKSELLDLCTRKGMKTNGIREKDLRIGLGKKLREERDIFQSSNERII
jgi:hypothetical protein